MTPPQDQSAVERGRALLGEQCGFCHGSNARGGSGGPDLTRSDLVLNDDNGRQLGQFLRVGRPDRGMPKFEMSDAQYADLAAFLHAAIYLNSNRRLYKILDIVVGDPKAGEAYFNGAGKCSGCHSIAGDLKGIGAKYEAVALQQRFLMPRGPAPTAGSAAESGPPPPLYTHRSSIKGTVTTASGETVTGGLVRLTDFDVALYEVSAGASTGRVRTWLRNGDTPKVTIVDPLQGHVDLLTKWTDTDMHNVTAYLAGLK